MPRKKRQQAHRRTGSNLSDSLSKPFETILRTLTPLRPRGISSDDFDFERYARTHDDGGAVGEHGECVGRASTSTNPGRHSLALTDNDHDASSSSKPISPLSATFSDTTTNTSASAATPNSPPSSSPSSSRQFVNHVPKPHRRARLSLNSLRDDTLNDDGDGGDPNGDSDDWDWEKVLDSRDTIAGASLAVPVHGFPELRLSQVSLPSIASSRRVSGGFERVEDRRKSVETTRTRKSAFTSSSTVGAGLGIGFPSTSKVRLSIESQRSASAPMDPGPSKQTLPSSSSQQKQRARSSSPEVVSNHPRLTSTSSTSTSSASRRRISASPSLMSNAIRTFSGSSAFASPTKIISGSAAVGEPNWCWGSTFRPEEVSPRRRVALALTPPPSASPVNGHDAGSSRGGSVVDASVPGVGTVDVGEEFMRGFSTLGWGSWDIPLEATGSGSTTTPLNLLHDLRRSGVRGRREARGGSSEADDSGTSSREGSLAGISWPGLDDDEDDDDDDDASGDICEEDVESRGGGGVEDDGNDHTFGIPIRRSSASLHARVHQPENEEDPSDEAHVKRRVPSHSPSVHLLPTVAPVDSEDDELPETSDLPSVPSSSVPPSPAYAADRSMSLGRDVLTSTPKREDDCTVFSTRMPDWEEGGAEEENYTGGGGGYPDDTFDDGDEDEGVYGEIGVEEEQHMSVQSEDEGLEDIEDDVYEDQIYANELSTISERTEPQDERDQSPLRPNSGSPLAPWENMPRSASHRSVLPRSPSSSSKRSTSLSQQLLEASLVGTGFEKDAGRTIRRIKGKAFDKAGTFSSEEEKATDDYDGGAAGSDGHKRFVALGQVQGLAGAHPYDHPSTRDSFNEADVEDNDNDFPTVTARTYGLRSPVLPSLFVGDHYSLAHVSSQRPSAEDRNAHSEVRPTINGHGREEDDDPTITIQSRGTGTVRPNRGVMGTDSEPTIKIAPARVQVPTALGAVSTLQQTNTSASEYLAPTNKRTNEHFHDHHDEITNASSYMTSHVNTNTSSEMNTSDSTNPTTLDQSRSPDEKPAPALTVERRHTHRRETRSEGGHDETGDAGKREGLRWEEVSRGRVVKQKRSSVIRQQHPVLRRAKSDDGFVFVEKTNRLVELAVPEDDSIGESADRKVSFDEGNPNREGEKVRHRRGESSQSVANSTASAATTSTSRSIRSCISVSSFIEVDRRKSREVERAETRPVPISSLWPPPELLLADLRKSMRQEGSQRGGREGEARSEVDRRGEEVEELRSEGDDTPAPLPKISGRHSFDVGPSSSRRPMSTGDLKENARHSIDVLRSTPRPQTQSQSQPQQHPSLPTLPSARSITSAGSTSPELKVRLGLLLMPGWLMRWRNEDLGIERRRERKEREVGMGKRRGSVMSMRI